MLVITLQKKRNCRYSYSVLLYNKGKRRVLRRLGKFFFDFRVGKFILSVDYFFILFLFKFYGVVFTEVFFKVVYKYVSHFRF
jgi:hypothetical protein